MSEIAKHLKKLKSFIAMDLMEEALELKKQGKEVLSLALGEPDFAPPKMAQRAVEKALREEDTYYTHSQGRLDLREAIVDFYERRYKVKISPEQIFISHGSSPAILLALSSLLNPGDEVLLPNLHYPCYPNFIHFLKAKPKYFDCSPSDYFQIHMKNIQASLGPKTKALLLANPSNPLGMSLSPKLLKRLKNFALPIFSDEVYQGLTYEGPEHSILEFNPNSFVFNGFSKSFSMTGFRLGYVIVPPAFIETMQKMFQNFYISTSSLSQAAGLAVIPKAESIQARYRKDFAKRREVLCEEIEKSGFHLIQKPEAAFYAFVNIEKYHSNSLEFCQKLLREKYIAVTPGIDFGQAGEGHIRFSYASSIRDIRTAFKRIREFLGQSK